MNNRRFLIGSRGSALALAQARKFAAELQSASPEILLEEKIIRTRGDLRMDARLAGAGPLDKGLFTRELEAALLAGTIDCAVHSLKDLPVEMPEGLALGAILPRENPADVLICKHGRLPGCIATSSPRRALQLGLEYPGMHIQEMRGNVPTRIRKLQETPSLDGLVLALAGLKRLGFCDESGAWLPEEYKLLDLRILNSMLPAPGQGAVAVQIRSSDAEFASLLQTLHCRETALCVTAERALLTELGGGCRLALGARADILQNNKPGVLRLQAVYFPEATTDSVLRGEVVGGIADAHKLASELKNQWIRQ